MWHAWFMRVTWLVHMYNNRRDIQWVMSHILWVRSQFLWVMSHIWLRRVAHMNESVHRCYSQNNRRDIKESSRTFYESCRTFYESCRTLHESCRAYEWGMSHIWMSHIAGARARLCNRKRDVKESCRSHEWVVSRIWMRLVPHMNESCHTLWMSHVTHEWVMSQARARQCNVRKNIKESCRTCEWVMSHIWIRHVTHMNTSCHT